MFDSITCFSIRSSEQGAILYLMPHLEALEVMTRKTVLDVKNFETSLDIIPLGEVLYVKTRERGLYIMKIRSYEALPTCQFF